MERVAILRFTGEITQGLQVVMEWGNAREASEGRLVGHLAPQAELPLLYQQWQQAYLNLEELYRKPRLELERVYIGSREDCDRHATELRVQLNDWLEFASPDFRPISRQLNSELSRHPNCQVLIQTNDLQLQQLPWHLWSFWQHHDNVEVILSPLEYRKTPAVQPHSKVRVLAILGNSQEINVTVDRQLLQQLPGIESTSCFLEQPTRQELAQKLSDPEGWDILFFAGHSCSEQQGQHGRIHINDSESLTIDELQVTLKTSIDRGLKLAIFNSCDGLGIAKSLVRLQIPQTIIMREPVPDEVAHKFLEFFLRDFSRGVPLGRAVKQARESLEAIQDQLPYATWLPIIFQHPLAQPLVWDTGLKPKVNLGRKVLGLAALGVPLLASLAIWGGLRLTVPAPLPLGDGQSSGEEILDTQTASRPKMRAAALVADCQMSSFQSLALLDRSIRQRWEHCINTAANYQEAAALFSRAWQEDDRKDPETLIYLNNVLLEAHQLDYYTIAVAVPLIRDRDGTVQSSDLARELQRGMAQLQTQINLGLVEIKAALDPILPKQGALTALPFKPNMGLKVVIVDDSNQVEKARRIAKSLVKQKSVLGVVGHYASEMTISTVDIYNNNQLVNISPGSTTEELTETPRPFFFRTVPTTGKEAEAILNHLIEQKKDKVTLLFNPASPFSASLWREFKIQFEQRVAKPGDFRAIKGLNLADPKFDAESFVAAVQKEPDRAIVLVPDGQVTNSLANAVDVIRANDGRNLIAASWGLYSPETLKIANLKPFEQLVILTPWHHLSSPDPDFPIQAEALWGGTISTRTAPAYDAALVLTQAISRQKRPTRVGTQKQLSHTDFEVDGVTGLVQFESGNGNRLDPLQQSVHVVPCRNRQYGLAFVPQQFETAKLAGLSCGN